MLVLGIECTAHTFGIGIIDCDKKKILFNKKNQFKDPDSGMDLRKLSDFHTANFDSVLSEAKIFLGSLGKTFSDLNLISFSQGPGIGNSLKIGALVAKTLSQKYNIKIVGVNHIRSHLEIGKMLTGFEDPIFLNITGVNSQVIAKDISGEYKVYGETEDIGLGNLLDSCARLFNIGFPGGPKIEELAKKSTSYIEIPYNLKGMNVSFAGIFSYVKQRYEKGEKVEDLCYSIQETVFAMLMEVAERAIAYTGKKQLVLVGGVASNKRFVEMAKLMCEERGIVYDSIPLEYCMDNGAMIAWLGFVERSRANFGIENLVPNPYVTIEDNF